MITANREIRNNSAITSVLGQFLLCINIHSFGNLKNGEKESTTVLSLLTQGTRKFPTIL